MARFKITLKVRPFTIFFQFGVRRGKYGEVHPASPSPAAAPVQDGDPSQRLKRVIAESRERSIESHADVQGVIVSLASIEVMNGDDPAGSHPNLGQWFLEPVPAEPVADEPVELLSAGESELLDMLLVLNATDENPELGDVRQEIPIDGTPVTAKVYINWARSFQCVLTQDGTRRGWVCIKITDDGSEFQGSWHSEDVEFETPWISLSEFTTYDAS